MKISKKNRQEAKSLLNNCQVLGMLDENRVRQTVQAVLARKPRGYLEILSYFQRLVELELDRRTARVESATELTPQQQDALKVSLANKYGEGLRYQFHQDPSLIGGLRLRIGSDVYDGSVRARLDALKEQFS